MLIDRIFSNHVSIHIPNPHKVSEFDAYMSDIAEANVLKLDNVAHYYYDESNTGRRDWVSSDFPSPVPCWPLTWVEFPINDDPSYGAGFNLKNGASFIRTEYLDRRWEVNASLITEDQNGTVVCWGIVVFSIEYDEIKMNQYGGRYYYVDYCHESEAHRESLFKALVWWVLYPALLGFSFANCKNVTKTKQLASKRQLKAHRRIGVPPPVKYYTLEIEPMKQILRTEGRSEEVGLKRALHICRGHFANYTDDKKLFGKISGRFWIPAHVRGSKEFGEVKKDYAIKMEPE